MNKTDTAQVATKVDIQRLEQNVKRFATKDDLKRFATKTELKKVEKSLRSEILRVEEKVENLQEGQEDMKKSLTRLQRTLDGFVGAVDTLRTETTVGAHQIRELDVRVTKLESSKPAA